MADTVATALSVQIPPVTSGQTTTPAKELIRLDGTADGKTAQVLIGYPTVAGVPGVGGLIFLFPSTATDKLNTSARIRLHAESAGIAAGGNGKGGSLALISSAATGTGIVGPDKATLLLDGETGNITVRNPNVLGRTVFSLDAQTAELKIGNTGESAQVYLYPASAVNNSSWETATIRLNSEEARIVAGGHQKNGALYLFPATVIDGDLYKATISLSASDGDIRLGGNGVAGNVFLFPRDKDQSNDDDATIFMSGHTGDIVLRGADCAEYFAVSEQQSVSPGTVLIAESDEMLSPSQTPYDKRVVGVVSGAGSNKPGILLGKDLKNQGLPIALSGKVYCNVDASNGAIGVGDLLTTSSTPGHAMKADDPTKSFGAIIGKALKPLTEGKGLIPILVALQ